MPANVNYWLQFDASQPKRKRAEVVCLLCHSKKVKCDLQTRHRQGHESCTNCRSAREQCHLRQSKRTKRKDRLPARENKDASRDEGPDTSRANAFETPRDSPMERLELSELPNTGDMDVAWMQGQSDSGQDHSPALDVPPAVIANPSAANRFSHVSPSQQSHRSQLSVASGTERMSESQKGDIDTGFLQVWGHENESDAQKQTSEAATALQRRVSVSDPREQQLMESFVETYFEYCYAWCPVLDPETVSPEMQGSPLLANAVAIAASHIQPPLLPHQGPAEYYKKARTIFYDDEEPDGLTTLKAIALFYWWAPRSPSIVHRHSSWWWTSVLIRHAQQMNLHREPALGSRLAKDEPCLSLRRRVWWTAFARERLTALCQSKPAIIDPDDCSVPQCTLNDFPADARSQHKGTIFIHWVQLCSTVGRVAKTLFRSGNSSLTTSISTVSSMSHIQELISWVGTLPADLNLQIGKPWTRTLDRDVHQLYLPYLTTIIILHLKRSEQPLPQALPPAIMAASCIARILRDILAKGNTRFLMAITCWYCGTAFIPLLQATRVPNLSKDANECIDILERTVEQLETMWASANVIRRGFQRLRATASDTLPPEAFGLPSDFSSSIQSAFDNPLPQITAGDGGSGEGLPYDWMALFPFVTRETNGIANCLLMDHERGFTTRVLPSDDELLHETLITQYDTLFDQYPDYGMDFMVTPQEGL